MNHQEPDRPPIQFYATPEVRKLLIDYFKGQDLKEVFEVDFRYVGPTPLKKPKKPIPGSDIDEYDMWGAGYKNSPYHLDAIDMSGTYPESVYLPFAEFKIMDEVTNYPWPSPEDFDPQYLGVIYDPGNMAEKEWKTGSWDKKRVNEARYRGKKRRDLTIEIGAL